LLLDIGAAGGFYCSRVSGSSVLIDGGLLTDSANGVNRG
jgi:hypothetical protein